MASQQRIKIWGLQRVLSAAASGREISPDIFHIQEQLEQLPNVVLDEWIATQHRNIGASLEALFAQDGKGEKDAE